MGWELPEKRSWESACYIQRNDLLAHYLEKCFHKIFSDTHVKHIYYVKYNLLQCGIKEIFTVGIYVLHIFSNNSYGGTNLVVYTKSHTFLNSAAL